MLSWNAFGEQKYREEGLNSPPRYRGAEYICASSVDAYGGIPKVVAGAIPANSLQEDLRWWVGFLIARRDSHFGVDTPGTSK